MCWVCSATRGIREPIHANDAPEIFLPFKKTIDFQNPAFGNKPVFTPEQIVEQLGGGLGVTPDAWAGVDISYSIPSITPGNIGANTFDKEVDAFVAPSAARIAAASLAFEMWDDLIAVNLNPSNDFNAQMTLSFTNATYKDKDGNEYTRTFAYTPTNGQQGIVNGSNVDLIQGGRSWFSNKWIQNLDANLQTADGGVAFGYRGFKTLMHEVGHMLGLKHPGKYNANADDDITYIDNAEFRQDTLRYTMMSYFREDEDRSFSNWGERRYTTSSGKLEVDKDGQPFYRPNESSTPMLMDILAIQTRYGADPTTRTGDDTYGFGSAIPGRPMYNFAVNPNPVLAIYDAGGTDTLNASGYSAAQLINLNPGTFSNIGGLTNNIAIAFNTLIENAVGGSGRDTIIGNEIANVLDGGAGFDILTGGAGDDQYLLYTTATNPTISPVITVTPNSLVYDHIVEAENGGKDTVFIQAAQAESFSTALTTSYALPDNVEDMIIVGSAAFSGVGNGLSNGLRATTHETP